VRGFHHPAVREASRWVGRACALRGLAAGVSHRRFDCRHRRRAQLDTAPTQRARPLLLL